MHKQPNAKQIYSLTALIPFVIRTYFPWAAPAIQSGQIDYQDLFQEGCLGILAACKRYKKNRGTTLATYARIYIRGKIGRFLNKNFLPNLGSQRQIPKIRGIVHLDHNPDPSKDPPELPSHYNLEREIMIRQLALAILKDTPQGYRSILQARFGICACKNPDHHAHTPQSVHQIAEARTTSAEKIETALEKAIQHLRTKKTVRKLKSDWQNLQSCV